MNQTIQTASDVINAKTAELVAFYNEHAEKPVTKFADRKTAEKRVIDLLRTLTATKAPEPKAPKEPKEPKAPADPEQTRAKMSEAQRALWQVEDVRAARCERSAVMVDGEEYRSVRAAFAELGLPMSKHIKFRGELKEAGKLEAFGCEWEIIPLNY